MFITTLFIKAKRLEIALMASANERMNKLRHSYNRILLEVARDKLVTQTTNSDSQKPYAHNESLQKNKRLHNIQSHLYNFLEKSVLGTNISEVVCGERNE